MKQIHILIIDDQFGRDKEKREDLTDDTCIVETEIGQSFSGDIGVVFCQGQSENGNKLTNDYDNIIAKAVEQGWGNNTDIKWGLVLLDVRFDSGELVDGVPKGQPGDETFGVNVREWLRRDFQNLPVVMFSGMHESEIKGSQEHYFPKTGISRRKLDDVLVERGKIDIHQKRQLLGINDNIAFVSKKMVDVYRVAYRLAETNVPILIMGESGSGKEGLAKYIHEKSSRSSADYVPFNIAAIPEGLIESILFGTNKGAFNGASNTEGLFEQANGGTLFLDEIGDMSAAVQDKILRAIQEQKVRRVGGRTDIPVDVRLICATHKNLRKLIDEGKFRDDLFYRINGTGQEPLTILPLRDRPEDIDHLKEFFLKKVMSTLKLEDIRFTDDASEKLMRYAFPGNVRELESIVTGLVVLGAGNRSLIKADQIKLPATKSVSKQDIAQNAPLSVLSGSTASSDKTNADQLSPLAPVNLSNLHEVIAAIDIKPDDPALCGARPRVYNAIQGLMQRCSEAALERLKRHDGEYQLRPAMRFLFDISDLEGTPALRRFEKIMNPDNPDGSKSAKKEEHEDAFEIWKTAKSESK